MWIIQNNMNSLFDTKQSSFYVITGFSNIYWQFYFLIFNKLVKIYVEDFINNMTVFMFDFQNTTCFINNVKKQLLKLSRRMITASFTLFLVS